jgi:hypothetical protein
MPYAGGPLGRGSGMLESFHRKIRLSGQLWLAKIVCRGMNMRAWGRGLSNSNFQIGLERPHECDYWFCPARESRFNNRFDLHEMFSDHRCRKMRARSHPRRERSYLRAPLRASTILPELSSEKCVGISLGSPYGLLTGALHQWNKQATYYTLDAAHLYCAKFHACMRCEIPCDSKGPHGASKVHC